MRNFRKYQVWELGHQITLDVYKLTTNFPKDEQYGLTSQMRRASSSVPANIADAVEEKVKLNSRDFLLLLAAQQQNWNIF